MHKSRQFTRVRDMHSTRTRKTFRLSAVIFVTAAATFAVLTPWKQLPYPNGPRFTGAFSGVLKADINHEPNKWKPVRLGGSPVGIVVPGAVADSEALSQSMGHDCDDCDDSVRSAGEGAAWGEGDGMDVARVGTQEKRVVDGHLNTEFERGGGDIQNDLVGVSEEEVNREALPVVAVSVVDGSVGSTVDGFRREERDLMTGSEGEGEVVGGGREEQESVWASTSGDERINEGNGWEAEKDLVIESEGRRVADGAGLGGENSWPKKSEDSKEDSFRREEVKEEGNGWEAEKDLVSESEGRRVADGAGLGGENKWAETSQDTDEESIRKEVGGGWEAEKDLVSGSEGKNVAEEAAIDRSEERTEENGGWVVENDLMSGLDDKGKSGWANAKGEKRIIGEEAVAGGAHGKSERDLMGGTEAKMMNGGGSGVSSSEANRSGEEGFNVEKQVASGGEKVAEGEFAEKAEEGLMAEVGGKMEEEGGVEVDRDLMSGFEDKKVETKGEGEKIVGGAKVGTKEERGEGQYQTGPLSGLRDGCLSHIIYDKPVKTGSSAVTVALRNLLDSKEQKYESCSFDTCLEPAKEVCDGKREKIHFVEHISAEEGLLDCLGRLGYYRVTSIREPLDRWESAFLYNRGQKANHYGIAFNESYGRFMALYPDCSLLDYYDGLGKMCKHGKLGVEERVRRIVGRYEEIIDLYDEDEGRQGGLLRKLLAKDVGQVNRSKRPDGDFRETFDEGRLWAERKLYDAFKKRQRELVGKEPRLCIG
eukprot:GFKZ01007485.1.p1 GENE.GFKZ01007485.1~~GFKZ01007485.1.p1  ORF type:complete len:771 (-),score=156.43 GFKZ01007485.1:2886-5171(-)